MTAISEKLSDERLGELIARLHKWTGFTAAHDFDRDVHAALLELQSLRSGNGGEVRVRKLEWLSGYGVEAEYAEPVTDIRYSVHRDDHNGGWVLFTGNAAREGNKHRAASRDEAKAAAQADFETRIRSALDIKP